jgi:hypothetical protein
MSNSAKPRVIVLGGGLGGTIAAYELRQKLKGAAEIHLVSDTPRFSFVPSNPWVAVGWRRPEAIQLELASALARQQIGFTSSAVRRVSAAQADRPCRRLESALRLSGRGDRPRPRVRRDRGVRSRGEGRLDLPHRPCRSGCIGVRTILRRPGPDRGWSRTGRVVFRAGQRIRDDPRHRAPRRKLPTRCRRLSSRPNPTSAISGSTAWAIPSRCSRANCALRTSSGSPTPRSGASAKTRWSSKS